jgi:hypothetical protein
VRDSHHLTLCYCFVIVSQRLALDEDEYDGDLSAINSCQANDHDKSQRDGSRQIPLHDEMLASEIHRPTAPKSAVDLMNKLERSSSWQRSPDPGQGQCMAEKYLNDAEGRETRVRCRTRRADVGGWLLFLLSQPRTH